MTKKTETKFERNRVLVLNEPNAPRLNPALAQEIGLNESILFLQLEFWVATTDHKIDGRWWCYESLTDLQEFFPFWSRMTINRAIKSLERQGLISVGNHNKAKYDRTRWFAINMDGVSRLESVGIRLYQNDTGVYQDGTRSDQNGTTIPEISSERSPDLAVDTEASGLASASSGGKFSELKDERALEFMEELGISGSQRPALLEQHGSAACIESCEKARYDQLRNSRNGREPIENVAGLAVSFMKDGCQEGWDKGLSGAPIDPAGLEFATEQKQWWHSPTWQAQWREIARLLPQSQLRAAIAECPPGADAITRVTRVLMAEVEGRYVSAST